jgi:hypothetical protein
MKSLLFSVVLAAGVFAQASLLTFDQGTKQIEGVNLSPVAHINDAQGKPTNINLDILGAGLRTKTVLFVAAKVYVAQLFADNKAAFTRDANALTSLVNNSKSVAMKLSLLRTVSADTLAVSFREGIEHNDYTVDAELEQMLNLIETSADAVQGKSVTMLMVRNALGGTKVYYEDSNGAQKSFVGSAGIMTKVMSIWLGKTADSGLTTLKQSLLALVY